MSDAEIGGLPCGYVAATLHRIWFAPFGLRDSTKLGSDSTTPAYMCGLKLHTSVTPQHGTHSGFQQPWQGRQRYIRLSHRKPQCCLTLAYVPRTGKVAAVATSICTDDMLRISRQFVGLYLGFVVCVELVNRW